MPYSETCQSVAELLAILKQHGADTGHMTFYSIRRNMGYRVGFGCTVCDLTDEDAFEVDVLAQTAQQTGDLDLFEFPEGHQKLIARLTGSNQERQEPKYFWDRLLEE